MTIGEGDVGAFQVSLVHTGRVGVISIRCTDLHSGAINDEDCRSWFGECGHGYTAGVGCCVPGRVRSSVHAVGCLQRRRISHRRDGHSARPGVCIIGWRGITGADIQLIILGVWLRDIFPPNQCPRGASDVIVVGGRILFIIILRILHDGQPHLFQIAGATGAARILPCPCEHREQDGGQDCYNGNHDQSSIKVKPVFLQRV